MGKEWNERGDKNEFWNGLGSIWDEELWVMDRSSHGRRGRILNQGFWVEFSLKDLIIWSGVMGTSGNMGDGKRLLLLEGEALLEVLSFFRRESMLRKLCLASTDGVEDFGCW